MPSKEEIIEGIKNAGMFYFEEIDADSLEDFDVASTIVQTLGEIGLNYLAEKSNLMSKRRMWRRLQDIAKQGIIDKQQNIEAEIDELTEGLEEAPSPWDELTEGLEEAPSPWDELTEGLEEAPSPWDELTEGLKETDKDDEMFKEHLEEELTNLYREVENHPRRTVPELAELDVLYLQIQQKEQELAAIKARIDSLNRLEEQVKDIDKENGKEDHSPFIG